MQDKKNFKNETNCIYAAFNQGTLNKKAAIDEILVFIYKNKHFYGLEAMDEDNFNEFLLLLIPIIGDTLIKFSPSKSSFSTFLQSVVRRNKDNFDRKLCIKSTNQKYLYYCAKIEWYNKYEKDFCCKSEYDELKILQNHTFSNKQLLVIALKCAYFLDDVKIAQIADKTGYNSRYIWSLKKIIDTEMEERYSKNQKRIESLSNSFYLKQKSAIYAQFKSKDDSVYERARYLEKFHSQRWNSKKTKMSFRFVVPTNAFLAELLGEKESFIANAIVKSKKYSKKI